MKKTKIEVPAGIRFLSEWKEFKLPEYPHLLDKQITGCGFTEWAITCPMNVILASPRLMLLENKEMQHKGQLYYAKNDLDQILEVDKNLEGNPKRVRESKNKVVVDVVEKTRLYKKNVQSYVLQCFMDHTPCKLLVTYDSYRLVYEALIEMGVFESFYTIIDEFQSIFTDSRFKSSTELEFVNYLQNLQKVCFVSATPMMEEYLDMLDEFKDLPYFQLDWGALEPSRITKPQLTVHPCQRITETALRIIQTYLDGKFERTVIEDITGKLREIESRELVIYVNSVKNICDIIKKAGLTYDNTNVLCSNTSENQRKIRRALGLKRNQVGGIGSVPGKDEPRKMFTLCTRTVYLGADFYSTNARSVILSDANIECLAVDITLDLPQILGRQRLVENPWKNRAELYVKILSEKNRITADDFTNYLIKKREKTRDLLSIHGKGTSSEKHYLAETYQRVAEVDNYKDNYVAVNVHGGKDLFPVFNNLVMVSEMRAFEVQQVDYADRFRVINRLGSTEIYETTGSTEMFLKEFNKKTNFIEKMRMVCEFIDENNLYILDQLPIDYKTYYLLFGAEKIKALGYRNDRLSAALSDRILQKNGEVGNIILSNFRVGEKLSYSDIKERLKDLYKLNDIKSNPKATDIFNIFDIKKIKITTNNGKRVDGVEILNIKIL